MLKKLKSEFAIFCFRPCLIHYKSLLEVLKVTVFFMLLQAFIFIVKLFLPAGRIESFLKESTAKKVGKLLSVGKILEAKELAKNGVFRKV